MSEAQPHHRYAPDLLADQSEDVGECLIAAYLADMRMVDELSPRSLESYEMSLRLADRDLPEGLVYACEQELKLWLYREGWAPATRALRLAALVSFFRWATRPGHAVLDFNPAGGLPRPKVPAGIPRPPTDQRLDELLGRCRAPIHTWALLATYQGMRCCEIADCYREDVEAPPGGTFIRGKGRRERYVPTHDAVWQAVRTLPAGPLARQANGQRRTAHQISQHANEYFDRIGVPEVTMHRLRHWYGTAALDECGNLRTVQELLGHASPTSTAIYTRVSSAARRAVVDALPLLPGAARAAD